MTQELAGAPAPNKVRLLARFLEAPAGESTMRLFWEGIQGRDDPDHSVVVVFSPQSSTPTRAKIIRFVAQVLREREPTWFSLEGNKWWFDFDALRARFQLGPEFSWLTGKGPVNPDYEVTQESQWNRVVQRPWVILRFERDTLQESLETPEQRRARIFDRMNFHPEVVAVGRSLFVSGHPDDAIFSLCKRVNAIVQDRTGIHDKDGDALFGQVFSSPTPQLKFTPCSTRDECNEQDGFRFLFQGLAKAIRNPRGHRNPRVAEVAALEHLSFISMLLRYLDGATP